MENPPTTFGQRLQFFAAKKRIKSGELAVATDVHPGTVSHWKKDRKQPTFDKVIKLSKVLDVSLDTLAGTNGSSAVPVLPDWLIKMVPDLLELDPDGLKAVQATVAALIKRKNGEKPPSDGGE
jgi:transcriptional regulator with XRE-family HTH domain